MAGNVCDLLDEAIETAAGDPAQVRRTLQNWEQGRRHPAGPARARLKIVRTGPEGAIKALQAVEGENPRVWTYGLGWETGASMSMAFNMSVTSSSFLRSSVCSGSISSAV